MTSSLYEPCATLLARALTFAAALTLTTLCFVAPRAQAQIANVADAVNREVPEGFTAVGSVSWDKRTGNNDTSEFTGDGTAYRRDGRNVVMFLLRRDFGQQKGVESSDSNFEHLRDRYAITDDLAAEVFVQDVRDPFRRISNRFVAGAGPRWRLYNEKGVQNLYLGVDPMYERERIDPSGPDDTEKLNTVLTRLSVSLAYDLKLDDRLTLHNTGYYQPVLTELKNHRLEDEAALTMHIIHHLDFKLILVVAHDSNPPTGVKPLDQQYKNALEFVF